MKRERKKREVFFKKNVPWEHLGFPAVIWEKKVPARYFSRRKGLNLEREISREIDVGNIHCERGWVDGWGVRATSMKVCFSFFFSGDQ